MTSEKIENPSLHDICLQIAWATSYAPKETPLDESHSKWADYVAYSEWFRNRISVHLNLPITTPWEELYRAVGCLNEEEYATPEKARGAYLFGINQRLRDTLAPLMFKEFEHIKYVIVGRV